MMNSHQRSGFRCKEVWIAAWAAFVVLSCADSVWAWGPAVHVGLADAILGNLGLLPAAVGVLLARHRTAFRYGSIAADLVFAKRLSRVKQFCHHWSTAFRLSEEAPDDRAKAFACGYLAHLAADTVAHGKFVPRQVVVSGSSINLGHLYWELRADAMQDPETWRRFEQLLEHDHEDHHSQLEPHMKNTFLPHEWNVKLFDRMNSVTLQPAVRRAIELWGRSWGSELSVDLLQGYRDESLERILSVLTHGTRSALVREDPNGTSALMQISVRRREARRLRRTGVADDRRSAETSRALSPSPLRPTAPGRALTPST